MEIIGRYPIQLKTVKCDVVVNHFQMNDKVKASQISITIENDLLRTINDTAKKSSLSRSKFIEKCIRSYLAPSPGPDITKLQQTIEQLQQTIERQKQLAAEKEQSIQQTKADGDARLKQSLAHHEQLLRDKDAVIKDKEQSIQQTKVDRDTQLKQAFAYHEQRLVEKLKDKDEQLVEKLKDKDAIIRDKEVVITEISNQNNWLRGEYAKLNDRLNALLLPAPKRGIWDKILRRKTASVD